MPQHAAVAVQELRISIDAQSGQVGIFEMPDQPALPGTSRSVAFGCVAVWKAATQPPFLCIGKGAAHRLQQQRCQVNQGQSPRHRLRCSQVLESCRARNQKSAGAAVGINFAAQQLFQFRLVLNFNRPYQAVAAGPKKSTGIAQAVLGLRNAKIQVDA